MDEIPLSARHESGNTGDTDIDLIYVTLKTDEPIEPGNDHSPQVYPEVPLELVLDNDRMIVQRLHLEPGHWTGAHSHPGNQVYIHIKGGTFSERSGGGTVAPPRSLAAGSVGWIDATGTGDQHDVGNAGDTAIELVLVTIK